MTEGLGAWPEIEPTSGIVDDHGVSGDRDGSSELAITARYHETCDELNGYLRKRFGDEPPNPEDITHEAFTKLAKLKDFKGIKHLSAFP